MYQTYHKAKANNTTMIDMTLDNSTKRVRDFADDDFASNKVMLFESPPSKRDHRQAKEILPSP